MSKRITSLAFGLLMVFYPVMHLQAQGTARLRVQVTVVPAVTAVAFQDAKTSLSRSSGAEMSWDSKQQNHVVTRKVKAADFQNNWNDVSNPCASQSTKVLSGHSDKDSCEIMLITVEFVSE